MTTRQSHARGDSEYATPNRLLRTVAFAPYVWIGLVFLLGATYAFPQTDDFCTFGRLFRNSGGNPFGETWYLYENWTGRYSSSFLIALVGALTSVVPAPSQWVYAGSLVAMMVAFGFSCLALSRFVGRDGDWNFLFATIVACASLVLMPSKLEGLFWLTGAAVYFIGVAFLLVLMQRLGSDDDRLPRGIPWLEIVLVVACVGMNEFLALALGGFLVLRIVFFARTNVHARENAILLSTFVAAFAFSVFAPGNFARDASITTTRHDISLTLELAQRSIQFFASAFIRPNALLLVLTLLVAFASGWAAAPRRWRTPGHAVKMLPAPLALLASFPMHLFVYSYLSGEETPGRILNQALVLFLSGACLLAAWGGCWVSTRRRAPDPRSVFAVMFVVGVFFVSSPQFRQLSTTERDFGPTWRAQQTERNRLLQDAALTGAQSVAVPPFKKERSTPPLFQGTDIGNDPAGWVNRCVADYYGVPNVHIAGDDQPVP